MKQDSSQRPQPGIHWFHRHGTETCPARRCRARSLKRQSSRRRLSRHRYPPHWRTPRPLQISRRLLQRLRANLLPDRGQLQITRDLRITARPIDRRRRRHHRCIRSRRCSMMREQFLLRRWLCLLNRQRCQSQRSAAPRNSRPHRRESRLRTLSKLPLQRIRQRVVWFQIWPRQIQIRLSRMLRLGLKRRRNLSRNLQDRLPASQSIRPSRQQKNRA